MITSYSLTNDYANIRLEVIDTIKGYASSQDIEWTSNIAFNIYFTNSRTVSGGYATRFNLDWNFTFNGVNYTGTATEVNSQANEKLVKTYNISIERGTGWNSDYISSVPFTFSATVSPGTTSANASWPTVTLRESTTAPLDRRPEAASFYSWSSPFTQAQRPRITYRCPDASAISNIRLEVYAANTSVAVRDNLPISNLETYIIELTDTEINTLCSAFPNTALNNTVVFQLYTTIEDNVYLNTTSALLNITGEDALPRIYPNTVTDINSDVVEYSGSEYCIVRYKSKVKCQMTYQCAYGATISRLVIDNGAQGSAMNFNTGSTSGTYSLSIDNITNWPIKATITDSRGYTNTFTLGDSYVNKFIDYVEPTCTLDVHMSPDGVATLIIKGALYNSTFYSEDYPNYTFIQYRYSLENVTYSDWIPITVNNADVTLNSHNFIAQLQITGLDYKDTYKFQAAAYDVFTMDTPIESAEQTITAQTVFDWSKNDFNFNVPINVNGDYYQYNSLIHLPQMGTWEPQCNAIGSPNAFGNYLRIGDMCFVSFYLDGIVSANPADVDFKLQIYGLPFTPDINQRWYAGGGNCQGYAVPAKGNSTGSPITYTPPSGAKTDHRFVGWSIEGGVIYGRTQCGFSSDDTAEYEYLSNNHSDVTLRKNYNYLKPEGSFYITALPGQQFYASGTILYKIDAEQGGIVG